MILIQPVNSPSSDTFIDVWQILCDKKSWGKFPDDLTIVKETDIDSIDFNEEVVYVLSAPGFNWTTGWLDGIASIPNKIIRLANLDKLKINYFVPESLESDKQTIVDHLYMLCNKIGLDVERIAVFLIDCDIVLDGSYPASIAYFPLWERAYDWQINGGINYHNPVNAVNLEKRSNKFICLNRIAKVHRLFFCALLHDADVAKEGILTYKHIGYDEGSLQHSVVAGNHRICNHPDMNAIIDTHKFLESEPYLIGDMTVREENNHGLQPSSYFTDAYWNFATESVFLTSYSFLTEKTFKPIANLQPFVIVSTPHILQALRYSGYKTFGDYIDESYDTIEDDAERLKAVASVAIKLAKMSHNDHIQLMHEIKPILEHNQNVFFNKILFPFKA